jgi:mannose-6-phosphate isomerase-like protein (cupin superfamily)
MGTEDLVVIEVQTGSSFAEEDIVRYEDSYGRV